MALLSGAELEDSVPPWHLVVNLKYFAGGDGSSSSIALDLDRPVLLPSTSRGDAWVQVFDKKSTALWLLSCLHARRTTFCALGNDGQVSVMAVGWTKLLVYDSFCPYLQRLFQAFQPIYAGGETWFVSRVTSEVEALASALRNVGRRVKSDALNTNADLRASGIHMCIVDYNYQYTDGSTSPSVSSQLHDSQKMLTYLGVWPNAYLEEEPGSGSRLRYKFQADDPLRII